jgi:hypothetical protein
MIHIQLLFVIYLCFVSLFFLEFFPWIDRAVFLIVREPDLRLKIVQAKQMVNKKRQQLLVFQSRQNRLSNTIPSNCPLPTSPSTSPSPPSPSFQQSVVGMTSLWLENLQNFGNCFGFVCL